MEVKLNIDTKTWGKKQTKYLQGLEDRIEKQDYTIKLFLERISKLEEIIANSITSTTTIKESKPKTSNKTKKEKK